MYASVPAVYEDVCYLLLSALSLWVLLGDIAVWLAPFEYQRPTPECFVLVVHGECEHALCFSDRLN